MTKVSARLGVAALAFVALWLPLDQARAFGLRLGPFFFGLPSPGVHRHRPTPPASGEARAEPSEVESAVHTEPVRRGEPEANEIAENNKPTLFYPDLILPLLDEEIFWPRSDARWSFGYQNIFDQAFTKYPDKLSADVCRYRDTSAQFVGRIAQQIEPREDQQAVLKQLVTALAQANGYLIKSCPASIPLRPVARLQLMDTQIDALIMALEIIHTPLQKFEQSLDDKQRAKWEGAGAPKDDRIASCNSRDKADETAWPLPLLEKAVQPTDEQRRTMDQLKDAFNRAASELAAECSGGIAHPASQRLGLIEDRLDATWRAVQTIQVALGSFQKNLNDEQNARVNFLEIASQR